MKKGDFLKLAALSSVAIVCISGQSPRKEVQVVPAPECAVNETEIEKPVPQKSESKQRKSAAQRSMEAESQESPRSAAQRSMEAEKELPGVLTENAERRLQS